MLREKPRKKTAARQILTILCLFFWFLNAKASVEEAIFAGGSFWALQDDFERLPGVLTTIVGYDGDKAKNPNYELVSSGKTQYVEAIRVIYNTDRLSYDDLVNYFWHHIDPTNQTGQFCDIGPQYRAVIFYLNKNQQKIALASRKRMEEKFAKIYTQVKASLQFYAAEDEHQEYHQKYPLRYRYYRFRCGRDSRIQELWPDQTLTAGMQ